MGELGGFVKVTSLVQWTRKGMKFSFGRRRGGRVNVWNLVRKGIEFRFGAVGGMRKGKVFSWERLGGRVKVQN